MQTVKIIKKKNKKKQKQLVKQTNMVASIKQSPVQKGHIFLVLI